MLIRQRQRFFIVAFYRGVILLFSVWVTWNLPQPHNTMVWPLLVFGGIYSAVLMVFGMYVKKWRYFQILLGITLVIDTLTWGLILIQFSATSKTDAPALLPVLSFEGLMYWGVLGGLLGLSAAELLMLNVWVYQKTVMHVSFSLRELSFWMMIVALIACLPICHLWSEYHLANVKKEKIKSANHVGSESSSSEVQQQANVNVSTSMLSQLTIREQEIYLLLKGHYSLTDIAEQCNIEYNTVKTHVRNIYRKFNVTNRHQLP